MGPKKILIVDDEEFVTDALESFFRSKGYGIFKAQDGQACLDIIKKEKLDLALLDIKLPKVDGVEILKILRRDYPETKAIIMTAYDIEYKAAVDNIGCDAFFVKPLLIEELTGKVEELLSSPAAPRRAPEKEGRPGAPELPAGPEDKFLPKARLLIISPRSLISGLLRDYFKNKDSCDGTYEVTEVGLEQSGQIKKFRPDIILLDVVFVGMLGDFGLSLMKMPHPPKEIILFGDPAVKWEEAEALIKRGTKFIAVSMDLRDEKYPIKETIQRLNDAVRGACLKHRLFQTKED
ncbi:MAG: response regulator [Candidatus Omnitrophota bacterium]